MRRNILILLLLGGISANAQLSTGGIPMSLQLAKEAVYSPLSQAMLPNWEASEAAGKETGANQPYWVALFTPADLRFPSSGAFMEMENGHQIWSAQLQIPEAKAIGLYYDLFHLPEGVKYYVRNAKGTQIIGAFTNANNAASGLFANEAIQGELVQLELDITPGVDTREIELHIDRAAVYFRGIEYLSRFRFDPGDLNEIDKVDSSLTGVSSVCMINASCPLGSAYAMQRKASFQTLLTLPGGVAACSATMINNTGNTKDNCKQYFVTATHCDPENSLLMPYFDQIIMRFNFEQTECNGKTIPVSNTMTGANFIARANYTAKTPQDIKGDFMLLELRQSIPAAWGINLSGWNRDANHLQKETVPRKFIGFHHPDGDVKKVSAAISIESTPINPSGTIPTHWYLALDSGLTSTGSSGSGLFDGDGYLMGIASVAAPYNLELTCTKTASGAKALGTTNHVFYSKLAYDWDYSEDGTEDKRKLKPWLDPTNSGVIKLDPVKSDCSVLSGASTGIRITDNRLTDAITIYPNPATGQWVNLKANLASVADLKISLWDINGKKVGSWEMNAIRSGTYAMDMAGYSKGIYLLKISDGHTETSKKILLL